MKKGPIIFLTSLVILLSFILGIQYGKRVEVTDQAVQELIQMVSLPPTEAPITRDPLIFEYLLSSTCGFSVVYPSSYTVHKISTYEGELLNGSQAALSFSCNPKTLITKDKKTGESTSSASFDGMPAVIYSTSDNETATISLTHPTRNSIVSLSFSQALKPLFESSFVFVK